jgi:predicted acyl esterase
VDQRGAFYYFDQHNLYNPKAEHYVLIGPYNHPSAASYAFSYISGYTIDKIANINISEIVFQWFDYIFKSKPKPQILKDKINYQVMCKNVWKHSPSYDKMINDTLALYFTPVKSGSFYTLDQKPGNDYIKQTIDYANRSDSAESKSFHYSMIEDTVLYTGECLKFISMPFDDSLEINGSFFGDVILSINKKDIDIFVDLYELMPDGRYFCFSNFLARASYIKDRSKRTLLTPGKWEKVPINNSFFTSRMVRKGSRIVAVLGMYKRRDWQINYGTGKDVSDESIADGRIPLEIKWSYKSNVKLPVYRYR